MRQDLSYQVLVAEVDCKVVGSVVVKVAALEVSALSQLIAGKTSTIHS